MKKKKRKDAVIFYRVGQLTSKSIEGFSRSQPRFLTFSDAVSWIMESDSNPKVFSEVIELKGKTSNIIFKIHEVVGEDGYFIFKDEISVIIYE